MLNLCVCVFVCMYVYTRVWPMIYMCNLYVQVPSGTKKGIRVFGTGDANGCELPNAGDWNQTQFSGRVASTLNPWDISLGLDIFLKYKTWARKPGQVACIALKLWAMPMGYIEW